MNASRATEIAGELEPLVSGRVAVGEPLGGHTTFRVGGPADVFVEAERADDLRAVADVVGGSEPIAIVGRGSNLLVSDEGFRGVAVKLGRGFRTHERMQDGFVFGGAVYLPAAAKLTARHGLAGFEFAAEIPGAFGGAVRMNAGAHGRSMADVLVWTETMDLSDGGERRYEVEDLGYRYRHSELGPTEMVTRGEIRLAPGDPDEIGSRISSHLAWRRAQQPPGRSAGSVFKNPSGDAAGRLIDEAGLKGMRVGGAEVSAVHGNFVVVDPDAHASDVWMLVTRVRDIVAQRSGVNLEFEVRFLGTFPQVEAADAGDKGQLEG